MAGSEYIIFDINIQICLHNIVKELYTQMWFCLLHIPFVCQINIVCRVCYCKTEKLYLFQTMEIYII